MNLFYSIPLGIGFYGNNKTKDGVGTFATSATNIHNEWDLYQLKVFLSKLYFFISMTCGFPIS